MIKSKKIILGLLFLNMIFVLQSCTHKNSEKNHIDNKNIPSNRSSDDFQALSDANDDKFEKFNRFSFELNNKLDKYILKPIAIGYRNITNQYTRDRVNSVFANMREPVSFANNVLQGDFIYGLTNIGRFSLNSTLGLAGMYDVADKGFGLAPKYSSFDDTLANYCVKDGPFLVLPLVGPTTPRAFVGRSTDGLVNPVFIATYNDANTRDKILLPYSVLLAVANRESSLDLIDGVKASSVDFYATVRSAYLQNRKKMKVCGDVKIEENEAKFDFDMSMDDDEL